MLLKARYVVPVCSEPIKNGAIRIEHGRIVEVGPARKVCGKPSTDFGDAIILPGFVNAHTHLELSAWADKVPPDADFTRWLERLRHATTASPEEPDFAEAARTGAKLSLAAGVTTVGDITSRPRAVRPALAHGPLRVVSYGEVIAVGTIRGRLAERLEAATDASCLSDRLTPAISPHAPYTIEADGIAACLDSAERLQMRMCMHLAESRDEEQYTTHGDGPLRDYLQRLGIWDDAVTCPKLRPIPYAHKLGALGPQTLLAHCNYVTDGDIQLLATTRTHVVYCPRTHAAFSHPPHRFRDMLRAGVNVCIGTDSLASNPSLSILDELRFLAQQYPTLDKQSLLEMATVRGANALHVDDQNRQLSPGSDADVTIVPLDLAGPSDPIENLLHAQTPPIATFVRGDRFRG